MKWSTRKQLTCATILSYLIVLTLWTISDATKRGTLSWARLSFKRLINLDKNHNFKVHRHSRVYQVKPSSEYYNNAVHTKVVLIWRTAVLRLISLDPDRITYICSRTCRFVNKYYISLWYPAVYFKAARIYNQLFLFQWELLQWHVNTRWKKEWSITTKRGEISCAICIDSWLNRENFLGRLSEMSYEIRWNENLAPHASFQLFSMLLFAHASILAVYLSARHA